MQQNFLSPNGFRLTIKRLPNVSFFVQAAIIPGLSMGVTDSPSPFKNMKFAGDKIHYDTFGVTIRLDEYMNSYNEIYNWMVGLTHPESFNQFKDLKNDTYGLYSDASFIILDSHQNPAIEVQFKDIFPISLGSINFDTTQADVNFVTCEITFAHNGYHITQVH